MPMWAALRPYIALEFRAGGGKLRVRVLERPGLWLLPAELDRLVAEMRRVVGSLGIGDLEYGILSGDPRHLERAILTLSIPARPGTITSSRPSIPMATRADLRCSARRARSMPAARRRRCSRSSGRARIRRWAPRP